nr:hypothetical protein [uncultured Flavobacterium sp.]
MKSEWITNYDENEIKVTNSWFNGEKLYVNNEIQDEQLNFITPSNLTGCLVDKNGNTVNIKANISGFFMVSCRLFIDHKKMELKQTK